MRRAFPLAVAFLLGLLVAWGLQGLRAGGGRLGKGAGSAIANGDTNGDGERDVSDAVYYLRWLFVGGPDPVPVGDGCPARFEDQGDGTVTDRETGLTWLKRPVDVDLDGAVSYTDAVSKEAAESLAPALVFAGHDDWELPRTCELATLVTRPNEHVGLDPAFDVGTEGTLWISSTNGGDPCHGATFAMSLGGFVELTGSACVLALRVPGGR